MKKATTTTDNFLQATREQNIKNFLATFPNNATRWSEATDEIRDLARTAKELYNELELDLHSDDAGAIEPLDFRALKTPAEWNTKGKQYIMEVYSKMSEDTKKYFYSRFDIWFNG